MRSARAGAVAGIAGLALWLAGCHCGSPKDAGVDTDTDTDTGFTCQVDDSQAGASGPGWEDWELTDGGEARQGYLCPRGDIDHYWFTVPTAGTIVDVHLRNSIVFGGTVDFCYHVDGADGSALGGQCDHPEDHPNQPTDLRGRHYAEAAGTYFLEVRDEGGDEEDVKNPYLVSLALTQDPDPYEPNNRREDAATPGGQAGYISFLGDRDWFAVTGEAGQILRLTLTTPGPTDVDLRYTLFEPDGTTPVNSGLQFDGQSGAADLRDTLPLWQSGTYYLLIQDEGDDDSDLDQGYTLTVELLANPDGHEPNDEFAAAVALTSGTAVSGYLASRGDEDWFVIERAGVDQNHPALLEVDLVIEGGSPVDPAVDLIQAHTATSCEPGDACDLLTATCPESGCDGETALEIKECQDARCPSHECHQAEGRCRGAGYCLDGGCALRLLTLTGANWGLRGDAHHLRTVAPMFAERYYVLVRDFGADALDVDNAYTLTVTARAEPDGYESPPNGIYLPYATNEKEMSTRGLNRGLAKTITCRESDPQDLENSTITCDPIEGYLSFRGDQDWYRVQMDDGRRFPPNEVKPEETCDTHQDWDLRWDWSFAGNPAMVVYYTAFLGGSRRGTVGFCATPGGASQEGACLKDTGGGTWGESSCAYFCGETDDADSLYLRVMHYDRKEYDFSSPYRLTLSALRQCPDVCSGCQADCASYCCPNPAQPEPPHWCGN